MDDSRVIIVGGGVSGLASLRSFLNHGFKNILLLEKESGLGGTWFYTAYPGLHTHHPGFSYRFLDEPNDCQSLFATREEVVKYLTAYASKNGMDSFILCNMEVIEVFHDGRRHSVICKNRQSGVQVHFTALHLIFASGFFSSGHGYIPRHSSLFKFKGVSVHSSEFSSSLLDTIKQKNLTVCVFGGGKSAFDLNVLLIKSGLGDKTTWIFRKSKWGLSSEESLARSADAAAVLASMPNSDESARQLRRNAVVSNLLCTVAVDEDASDEALRQCRGAHYSMQEIALLRCSAKMHRSWLQDCNDSSVLLENGVVVPADVIIWATGYRVGSNLPRIVSQNGVFAPTMEILQRGCKSTSIPNTYFLTCFYPSTLLPVSACLMAEWCCRSILGLLKMHDVEESRSMKLIPECTESNFSGGSESSNQADLRVIELDLDAYCLQFFCTKVSGASFGNAEDFNKCCKKLLSSINKNEK